MPIRRHRSFNSFTNAMFTQRYMFSSSLVISAAAGFETGTTRLKIEPYSSAADSDAPGSSPPHHLGNITASYRLISGIFTFRRESQVKITALSLAHSFQARLVAVL